MKCAPELGRYLLDEIRPEQQTKSAVKSMRPALWPASLSSSSWTRRHSWRVLVGRTKNPRRFPAGGLWL